MPKRAFARMRRRWWKNLRRAPPSVQLATAAALLFALWAVMNAVYQVARKPSELFFPVSGVLYKTPAETWRHYGRLFREHSTEVITPELLAALAQVEGSGNPVVRTPWRWALTAEPFEVYQPASSAVGMYQITDGTFTEARRYCIHHHAVAEDGPWHELRSCWFNLLYTRVLPNHAIELTSAYLDRHVAQTLRRYDVRDATLEQKQNLAALMHLCGVGAAARYASRGFRLAAGERCGAHDAARYVRRVSTMRAEFARLAHARAW